jgi:hypothetical protein
LDAYHCDEALAGHQPYLDPELQPTLIKWTTSGCDDLWMQPRELLLAEAMACYEEHFALVISDILALPHNTPVLAEGTCLLPGLVNGVTTGTHQAIWMVPTEGFQRLHYPQRGPWVQAVVSQCSEPQQALRNWMERDVAFAKWVTSQTRRLGLSQMTVDGQRSIAENAELAAQHLRLETGQV